jgi:DNA-binding response OmpR family regulator
VLVVEDEFIIALDVQRMMEEAGASEVTVAYSIEEARDLLAKGIHFDMGVVDLKLGGQDARPLIGELRARNIPLIVATGFDPGLEIEDTVVISKPYSDETVLSAIRELLSRSGK